MEQLQTALERVTAALAALRYRLAVLIALLSGGQGRFLGQALADLDEAVAHLYEVESSRNAVTARLAAQNGQALPVTLVDLADAAIGPDRDELLEWHTALLEQTTAVHSSLELATVLAQAGHREVRGWLERFATGHDDVLYGRDGAGMHDGPPPTTHDGFL